MKISKTDIKEVTNLVNMYNSLPEAEYILIYCTMMDKPINKDIVKYSEVIRKFKMDITSERVKNIIGKQAMEVLNLRYRISNNSCLSYNKIATMLGITANRANQIDSKALRTLRILCKYRIVDGVILNPIEYVIKTKDANVWLKSLGLSENCVNLFKRYKIDTLHDLHDYLVRKVNPSKANTYLGDSLDAIIGHNSVTRKEFDTLLDILGMRNYIYFS